MSDKRAIFVLIVFVLGTCFGATLATLLLTRFAAPCRQLPLQRTSDRLANDRPAVPPAAIVATAHHASVASKRALTVVADGDKRMVIGGTVYYRCEPRGRYGMGKRTLFYSSSEARGAAKIACFGNGWEPNFERYIVREAMRLSSGDVIEIGANVGLFTQALAHAISDRLENQTAGEKNEGGSVRRKVHAYDADPFTFAALKGGLRWSPVSDHVTAHHAAISQTSGELQFCVRPQYPVNSRIVTDNKPCAAQFATEIGVRTPFIVPVPALTPADVFPLPLGSYSFVKIDADWAEGPIWKALAALHMARGSERFRSFTLETNAERDNVMTAQEIALGVEKIYGAVGVMRQRDNNEVCVKIRGDAVLWTVRGRDHVICAGSDVIFS